MPKGKKAPKGSVANRAQIARFVPVRVGDRTAIVPVNKQGKVPASYLHAVHNAREDRGKNIDKAKTRKGYLKTVTPDQAGRWMGDPRAGDIKNIDTPTMRKKKGQQTRL